MEYRQLGESDLKVSAVTMGTWAIGGWMWGGTDEAAAIAAIQKAIDRGMTSIDTAPIYGMGLSEEIVGKAIAGRRDEVQVRTKYGMRWDLAEGKRWFGTQTPAGKDVTVYLCANADSIVEECERSLQRLGVDVIDLYQCHWRDVTTPVEETMAAVDKLLTAGKIRAAGVSNFTAEEITAAKAVIPLASNQPPYSMLKRDIEAEIVPCCIENNVGLVVYSTLQLGLLTGKVTPDREFADGDQRRNDPMFSPENHRRVSAFLEAIRPVADGHNATLAQLAINWTIHRPGITVALVGARSPAQAAENAAAADFTLTDEEAATINAELDKLELEQPSK